MYKNILFLIISVLSMNFALANNTGRGELIFSGSEVQKKKLDILFVLDNSGSMSNFFKPTMHKVSNTLSSLSAFASWRAAFVTSNQGDFGYSNIGLDGSINTGTHALEAMTKLWDGTGSATEVLFETIFLARNNDIRFFREDARLVVVYITDEDDQSVMSAEEFIKQYKVQYNATFDFKLITTDKVSNCSTRPHVEMIKLQNLLGLTWGDEFIICSNFSTKLRSSLSKHVKLELLTSLPLNSVVTVFIDDVEFKNFKLSLDRSRLYLLDYTKLLDSSVIKINFTL